MRASATNTDQTTGLLLFYEYYDTSSTWRAALASTSEYEGRYYGGGSVAVDGTEKRWPPPPSGAFLGHLNDALAQPGLVLTLRCVPPSLLPLWHVRASTVVQFRPAT